MMACVGCSRDMSSCPRERRNLNSLSKAAQEPRERVLAAWKKLMQDELNTRDYDLLISDVYDPQNPGILCRKCFADYDKYAKLQSHLTEGLKTYLSTLNLSAVQPQDASTPIRRRREEDYSAGLPPRKRLLAESDANFTLSSSASPAVMVKLCCSSCA